MKEFKHYADVGIPLMNPAPEGFNYVGGKADDITVTLAQVFLDKGSEDSRRNLSENDYYYPFKKTVYEGGVYDNSREGFKRARFNERHDNAHKPISKDTPTKESVEEMIRIAQMNQMLAQ